MLNSSTFLLAGLALISLARSAEHSASKRLPLLEQPADHQ